MTADDEGYYNTTTLNTFIQVDDLQRDIQERGTGENNVLQSEYKVYISFSVVLNTQAVCSPFSKST